MKSPLAIVSLVLLAITSSGCEFIGDVIAFGFWLGVVVVALVALAIYMLLRWFRRR